MIRLFERSSHMPTIEKFCATGVFDPPTYSQGIKVNQAQTILFLSGQVAYTADGGVACRGDFKGQARGAYEAIKALVESQGGTMGNIVKITTFVTDIRYRLDLAPLREEFFGAKGPASTLVEISALAHPDWMIEIEAIAVL
jgi:2-iminobutanoate/2-iminopropanoate deaminase